MHLNVCLCLILAPTHPPMNGKIHPAQSAEEATEATEVPESTANHAEVGPPGPYMEHIFTGQQPRPADGSDRYGVTVGHKKD